MQKYLDRCDVRQNTSVQWELGYRYLFTDCTFSSAEQGAEIKEEKKEQRKGKDANGRVVRYCTVLVHNHDGLQIITKNTLMIPPRRGLRVVVVVIIVVAGHGRLRTIRAEAQHLGPGAALAMLCSGRRSLRI
jgi:hypothetical protein